MGGRRRAGRAGRAERWAGGDGRDDLDPKAIRRRLEREREDLRQSSAAAAESRAPVELDQQNIGRLSRMGALQDQAMAKAVDERRHERLSLIDAALKRLDAGDYGYCAACDEEIPAKRLAIDPVIARCIKCAK